MCGISWDCYAACWTVRNYFSNTKRAQYLSQLDNLNNDNDNKRVLLGSIFALWFKSKVVTWPPLNLCSAGAH